MDYPSGASRAVGARCNVVDRESRRSIVMYTVARRSIVAESRKVKKAGAAGHLEDLSRAQVRTTGSRKWNVGRELYIQWNVGR